MGIMKRLYEASSSIEAHMILNLLEQEGLKGRIDGEYLQGGVGELPAAGLVRVMVAEEDYVSARSIVDKWDAAQPQSSPPAPRKRGKGLVGFAAGLLAGVACTYLFFSTPVRLDGVDRNHDGVLDEKWNASASGRMLRSEVDRNLDGKIDLIVEYGNDGLVARDASDDDFNGVFESHGFYRDGIMERADIDTDGDSLPDLRSHFRHGVITSTQYLDPKTGLPLKIEHFALAKVTHAELDSDRDGTLDTRITYDSIGEVVAREPLR